MPCLYRYTNALLSDPMRIAIIHDWLDTRITAAACRANAERFSRQTFNRRFSAYVTDALAQHRSRPHP